MDKITKLDAAISALLRVLIIQERRVSNGVASVPFNPLDLETLSFVSRHHGATAKDIASYLMVSATTMQSVVDRLEKRGYLAKDKAALKGRAIAISLTAEGALFRDLIQAHNMQNCATMLTAVDPQDQDKFIDSLTKIAARFSNEN